MTVSFVSTPYLGTAMLPAVNQAEAQLTSLGTEATTGEYADLGLQLGDQSGYELSLRNADDLLRIDHHRQFDRQRSPFGGVDGAVFDFLRGAKDAGEPRGLDAGRAPRPPRCSRPATTRCSS